MPYIQIPTGKTIYVSTFEYYFLLREEDVDEFFQSCIADDIGEFMEDPFSNRMARAFVKEEIEEEIPEISDTPNLDIEI